MFYCNTLLLIRISLHAFDFLTLFSFGNKNNIFIDQACMSCCFSLSVSFPVDIILVVCNAEMSVCKDDGADKKNGYKESMVLHNWVEILFYWQQAHKGPSDDSLLLGRNSHLLMILQLSCGSRPKKRNIYIVNFQVL